MLIDIIYYVQRHGLRWVDAPVTYGPYKNPCNRFRRWSEKGVFRLLFSELARSADTESEAVLTVDCHLISKHVAPPPASTRGGAAPRLIGRTKGGLTSKRPVVCDGKGRPARLHLTTKRNAATSPVLTSC